MLGLSIYVIYLAYAVLQGQNACSTITSTSFYLYDWMLWTTCLILGIHLTFSVLALVKSKITTASRIIFFDSIISLIIGLLNIYGSQILVKISSLNPTSFLDYPIDLTVVMVLCYTMAVALRFIVLIITNRRIKVELEDKLEKASPSDKLGRFTPRRKV